MAAFTEEFKQKVREYAGQDPERSNRSIGRHFNIDHTSVSKILASTPAKDVSAVTATPELTEINEVKGDDWTITMPKTRISSLEDLLEYCKVDMQVWMVDRFLCNKWEVGAKNEKGKIEVEPLFQVKAFLKRRKEIFDARIEIDKLKEEAKQHMRIPEPVVYSTQSSDNMLELLIPDLHVAKLAWAKETGGKNYDVPIAVETYRRAYTGLINKASSINLSKIVLGVGNDLLQADNIQGTTYSGTKVDVDSRYRKTYVTARLMLTEAIQTLRKIAPVEVKVVPGNHDTLSAFTLGDSLECTFHNYQDVSVDNAPALHKIVEWGDVLLALMHGHAGKQTKYGIWLASQYPVEFGRTKFREVHVGHKHKSAVDEEFGIRVRTFSALCPADEWHATNLFTGNLRVAEGLLWNKTFGLSAQYFHTEVD